MSIRSVGAVVVGIVLLLVGWQQGAFDPVQDPASPALRPPQERQQPGAPEPAVALRLLDTIPVKGRAPKTGYHRETFTPGGWPSIGHGCDVRDQILARDLIPGTRTGEGCNVVTGQILDPYSGLPRAVKDTDIDHIVAQMDAWQKGAQHLTAEERLRFATDPDNLVAVDSRLNRQKGAGDAATWLPPNKGWRCEYVTRQVMIKERYHLWVTAAERDAIGKILDGCR